MPPDAVALVVPPVLLPPAAAPPEAETPPDEPPVAAAPCPPMGSAPPDAGVPVPFDEQANDEAIRPMNRSECLIEVPICSYVFPIRERPKVSRESQSTAVERCREWVESSPLTRALSFCGDEFAEAAGGPAMSDAEMIGEDLQSISPANTYKRLLLPSSNLQCCAKSFSTVLKRPLQSNKLEIV